MLGFDNLITFVVTLLFVRAWSRYHGEIAHCKQTRQDTGLGFLFDPFIATAMMMITDLKILSRPQTGLLTKNHINKCNVM